MVDEITIRQATLTDAPDLVRLRRMMFEAMGWNGPAQLNAGDAAAAAYFTEAIPAGTFHGWLAITSAGVAVGSGGAVIDQHPPGPGNLSGQIGYIMSLVTDPRYRRRVMQTILKWLMERGIQRVELHATEMGRPLYKELGFKKSNAMRLRLQGTA